MSAEQASDLAEELSALPPEQRAWAERQLAHRRRAGRLAPRLGLDVDDVYQMLRHLDRSPGERLALGLLHGRLAPSSQRR